MKKSERLETALAGGVTDRVPASLWCHWPGDDQRTADLARSTVEFQQTYDWDFVKVTPFSTYCVADYGVQTEWRGDISGDRTISKYLVKRSLAWTELRTLEPSRGELGKHLEVIRLIQEVLHDDEVPIITTIYSPLTQAAMIGGTEMVLRSMRMRPDRLRTALNIITESTLRFIDSLKRTGLAGIHYSAQYASFELMSEEEYKIFGSPYDLKILGTLPAEWWLNILQLSRNAPMFTLAAEYPVQAINWDTTITKPNMEKARSIFPGALCCGLSHQQHLHMGTPSIIRDVAHDALNIMGMRRLILSAGAAFPVSTPRSNIRAVRQVVDSTGTTG